MLALVVCASPLTGLGPSPPPPQALSPTPAASRIWGLFALSHRDDLWCLGENDVFSSEFGLL